MNALEEDFKTPRNTIEFEVYGDYALFSDPITRVGGEKCSYRIPTYEALKGVLHSIYWKPTIIWIVDKVRVMNQIQMETKGIRLAKYNCAAASDLSYYTYLKKCRYQVSAHFIFNLNRKEMAEDRDENKHYQIAKRMVEKGGRRDIFLGTRECQADVQPCVFGSGDGFYDNSGLETFGRMYHGITYPDEAYSETTKGNMTVRFWNAQMQNGVILFPLPWRCVGENERVIRECKAKTFGKNNDSSLRDDILETKK